VINFAACSILRDRRHPSAARSVLNDGSKLLDVCACLDSNGVIAECDCLLNFDRRKGCIEPALYEPCFLIFSSAPDSTSKRPLVNGSRSRRVQPLLRGVMAPTVCARRRATARWGRGGQFLAEASRRPSARFPASCPLLNWPARKQIVHFTRGSTCWLTPARRHA